MKRVILTAVLAMVFVNSLLLPAWSQRADRPRRVGVLFPGLSSDPAKRPPVLQALVDGLREHGWEEGRNVVLEVRKAYAVFMLMVKLNRSTCSTGSSAGLAPLKIRSTMGIDLPPALVARADEVIE